jgi:hypothetical protein
VGVTSADHHAQYFNRSYKIRAARRAGAAA